MGIETFFWVAALGLFLLILGSFALGGFLAAPWVPLWKKDVKRMLTIAKVNSNDLVYDLGAGDGRIICAAAKDFGARAVGFEIAVLPYFFGWLTIYTGGLQKKATLRYRNFFYEDFKDASVVCMFLMPAALKKLKSKLETECKPGTRIVSYAFAIPGWTPAVVDKPSESEATIYLYVR